MIDVDGYRLAYITYNDVGIENLHKYYLPNKAELMAIAKKKEIPIVVLETCNRIEIYSYKSNLIEFLQETLGDHPFVRDARLLTGKDVFIHLAYVASGIDSLATGETQILGQVRRAYLSSKRMGTISRELIVLFDNTIRIARKVRRKIKSKIPDYLNLSKDLLDKVNARRIVIIGSGDMAKDLSKIIERDNTEVFIASKNIERAKQLAHKYGFNPITMQQAISNLKEFDAIITCTSTIDPIIRDKELKGWNGKLIIDLGMPSNTKLEKKGTYEYYNLIELSKLIEKEKHRYMDIIYMLKENVKNEANKVIKDLFENKHEEVVALLYKKAEEIRRKEVAEALSLLSRYVDKETLDNIAVILEGLTSSIIRKLYHPYSEAIRMIGNGNDSKEFIKLILTLNGESVDGD